MPKALNPIVTTRPSVPLVHRDAEKTGQSRFNEEATASIRALAKSPLASHNHIDITIETAATKVTHRLGRAWQGWVLVDRTGTGTINRVDAPSGETEDHDTHFWLQASVQEDVRILVY